MGAIKVTPNPDPAGPALKIEYQGSYPAGSGVHYADEWTIELDPWIRLEKPRLREVERTAHPPSPTQEPASTPPAPQAPSQPPAAAASPATAAPTPAPSQPPATAAPIPAQSPQE